MAQSPPKLAVNIDEPKTVESSFNRKKAAKDKEGFLSEKTTKKKKKKNFLNSIHFIGVVSTDHHHTRDSGTLVTPEKKEILFRKQQQEKKCYFRTFPKDNEIISGEQTWTYRLFFFQNVKDLIILKISTEEVEKKTTSFTACNRVWFVG